MKVRIFAMVVLFSVPLLAGAQQRDLDALLPEKQMGILFYDVMNCDSLFGKDRLFAEPKTFLDMQPRRSLAWIKKDYETLQRHNASTLIEFINKNFTRPIVPATAFTAHGDIDSHIRQLWSLLRREPENEPDGTFIHLKHPYFVPGGRFGEIYYWDSYFSMLGMVADGEGQLARDMVDNFAELIDSLGFIPNGNRTYYVGRSQPPFFSLMVDVIARTEGKGVYLKYLDEMQKEYDFWMKGSDFLSAHNLTTYRCVEMPDGSLLNRYYDKYDTPREEMYRSDLTTAGMMNKDSARVLFRNLRAAAESGWDFSSRWMRDEKDLATTQTMDIIPIDLNCLLHHLEKTLAKAYGLKQNKQLAGVYALKAERREKAIKKYCWSETDGFYKDYIWTTHALSHSLTAAGAYALFEHIADKKEAKRMALCLRTRFLKQGGIVTTLLKTGQQWDEPNAWAPLQWITCKGLYDYGFLTLSKEIRNRWMRMCQRVYRSTGKLLEKYDAVNVSSTGGGEYPNQDGFGWTNGVYKALQSLH